MKISVQKPAVNTGEVVKSDCSKGKVCTICGKPTVDPYPGTNRKKVVCRGCMLSLKRSGHTEERDRPRSPSYEALTEMDSRALSDGSVKVRRNFRPGKLRFAAEAKKEEKGE